MASDAAFDTRRIGVVDVALLDRGAALARIDAHLEAGPPLLVAFCNAHTANMARCNTAFAAALREALVLNDGVGVDLASRLLYGQPFADNLNGTDLTWEVLERSAAPRRIFLLGSAPGIAERAALEIARRCPRHQVVGVQHGFFDKAQGAALGARIKDVGTDLLLVGMGHPRQELFAAQFGRDNARVTMCIGAWIDFAAGTVSRAPPWLRAVRAEWLYRLALEPRRLAKRYLLGNAAFLAATLQQCFKQKRAAE